MSDRSESRLGELSTLEVAGEPVVVIPLGAVEQHGPHLPLDTDGRIASAWASAIVRDLTAAGTSAMLAPTVAYGASGEHQGFAGTMSVGSDVMRDLVVELARSMRDWAGTIVFVSGHAGNHEALAAAMNLTRTEGQQVVGLIPVLPNSDAHAGRTETSLMLHLHPELVQLHNAAAGRTEPIGDLMPALRERGVLGVSPNGVLGDPTGASAEEGAELLSQLVSFARAQLSAAGLV